MLAPPSAPARTYQSYASLVEDPEVEAVYVPLPNSLHREWVERAAAAGKHVLCEKPLAPTAADARAMADACAAAGVALLEAYMTPFHPRARAVEALVASGRLGALRFGRAVFTGVLDRPDDHRWRPEMGGGALLDVGIYCVAPLLAGDERPAARASGGGGTRQVRRRRLLRGLAPLGRRVHGGRSSAPSTRPSASRSSWSGPRPPSSSIAHTPPEPRTPPSRSGTATVAARRWTPAAQIPTAP